LDIFKQTISKSELVKKLMKRQLLVFKKYQLDIKNIKIFFQWWQKHEVVFPTIGFLAQHILGVVEYQIEI
jgi:hypothetical protein